MISTPPVCTLSDWELITLYLHTKEQQYFTTLYIRHRQRVYETCLGYTGNSDDADDFVQDIFMRLMDRLTAYRGEALFTTWLRSVAANYCLDQLRKQKRQQALWLTYRLDLTTATTAWTIPAEESSSQPAYEQMFDQLPVVQRELLYSKYGAGASINDIAIRQGLTPSAVKMRIKRAKELAYTLFKQLQVDEDRL